ncbi:DUF397 domain-containing protein [Streptomyces sp. GQFP]|uniref:DUF397 domain-containing protein n=1 Tax=Streptomyces sp. GQFP TaxID=2907545 RepID=UPI001F3607E7|nr:DUF397 domain-containing protein [Streptomyces sp. GQFP]UIX32513.1 DUF397 domain-containing protein [Streptomyces sp. GQFP]
METSQQLTAATWRKSSYSGTSGGDCVECAPLGSASWRKSSYSADTGGECVEVAVIAPLTPHIAIRDSKAPALGALTLTPEAFGAFVRAAARTTQG